MMDRGTEAENLLAKFIAEPLLLDFVHIRPTLGDGRELCDVLVEDEPIGIPVQLKAQDRVLAKRDRDPKQWALKRIYQAQGQLSGAIRSLLTQQVFVSSVSRGPLSFQAGQIKPIHGIVILDYSDLPFQIPSDLPRRTEAGVTIHYLSYDDFIILCEHLMTLPDLIDYLNQRANIPAWATPMLNDERNAYAYYTTHQGAFPYALQAKDFQSQWDLLTTEHSTMYQEKLQADKKAEVFSLILKMTHDVDPDSASYTPAMLSRFVRRDAVARVEVTRKLNRVRRIHRREFAKRLLEKARLASTSKLGFNYFAFMSEDQKTLFLVLASRHPREKRIEQLTLLLNCLLNIYNVEDVVGLGTENIPADGRSYDFVMMDEKFKDTDPDAINECKKLFGELRFERFYDFPGDKKILFVP